MKISVAMATYNGEKYIIEQLNSIGNQSQLPDELVVCDDNSQDKTVELIEEFGKNVTFPIRLLRNNENLGFVGTFNRALEVATGDLVFLCDQDDFWFPNKIDHISELAQANPEVNLFLNNAELTDGKLIPSGLSTFGQMESVGQDKNDLVLGCCMALRKNFLSYFLPIPSRFSAHDIWLNEFSVIMGSKLLVPEILQYYRRHAKNESSHIIYRLKKVNRLAYSLDYYKKLFYSNSIDSLNKRIYETKMKIESIGRAIQISGVGNIKELEARKNCWTKEVGILIKREEIAKKDFFSRLTWSTKLWKEGGYESGSGIKSYLRDIFGNK